MKRILVVCQDNAYLSPIAHAYLQFYAADQAVINSAGFRPSDNIHLLASTALQSDNLEVITATPIGIDHFSGQKFDTVLYLGEKTDILVPADVQYDNLHTILLTVDSCCDENYQQVHENIKRELLRYIGKHLPATMASN